MLATRLKTLYSTLVINVIGQLIRNVVVCLTLGYEKLTP